MFKADKVFFFLFWVSFFFFGEGGDTYDFFGLIFSFKKSKQGFCEIVSPPHNKIQANKRNRRVFWWFWGWKRKRTDRNLIKGITFSCPVTLLMTFKGSSFLAEVLLLGARAIR